MKTATWKDGSQTIRKTHTRDYQFAYRVTWTDSDCVTEGFSTTMKAVTSAANTAATLVSKRPPRGMGSNHPYWKKQIASEWYQTQLAREKNSIIEIVEVETA